MLLQQFLSVWTQPSEILTDPFSIQQSIKCNLEVMRAFETQQGLSEVAPSPDLWRRTSFRKSEQADKAKKKKKL